MKKVELTVSQMKGLLDHHRDNIINDIKSYNDIDQNVIDKITKDIEEVDYPIDIFILDKYLS